MSSVIFLTSFPNKVAIDFATWQPLSLFLLSLYMNGASDLALTMRKFMKSIKVAFLIWPAAHIINFLYMVPAQLNTRFMNFMQFIFTVLLSYVLHSG